MAEMSTYVHLVKLKLVVEVIALSVVELAREDNAYAQQISAVATSPVSPLELTHHVTLRQITTKYNAYRTVSTY